MTQGYFQSVLWGLLCNLMDVIIVGYKYPTFYTITLIFVYLMVSSAWAVNWRLLSFSFFHFLLNCQVQCNDLFSWFYLSFSSFTLENLLWLKLMQASPDKDANSDGQQLYRATFCNYFSIGEECISLQCSADTVLVQKPCSIPSQALSAKAFLVILYGKEGQMPFTFETLLYGCRDGCPGCIWIPQFP